MYVFGIAIMLGLGVMCVARWVERPLQRLGERLSLSLYALMEVGLGVGLAWAVNFNLWSLWGINMRADWIAVTLTGLAIGGIAQFFTEVLALFSGFGRKLNDEAETIERPTKLERVA
jgi:hypothetical protein